MKVGIIGYGSIGRRHEKSLLQLGHEVLTYDPVNGDDVWCEHHIYDNCEAVVIASPTRFHEQAISMCVSHDVHMLIEKPMGRQIGVLPALLTTAQEKGLTVMMGNNLRFHPCVQGVKRWLAERKIGDPLWASFTCATEGGDPGGDGVILNTGAHEVDLALYFFGPARCVFAYSSPFVANFGLEHDNGVRSTFHLNLVTPNRIREFWIAGSEANIGVDLDARQMAASGNAAIKAPGAYEDDYANEMSGFIDRINGNFAPGASGQDGLATLKVLLGVQKKAKA